MFDFLYSPGDHSSSSPRGLAYIAGESHNLTTCPGHNQLTVPSQIHGVLTWSDINRKRNQFLNDIHKEKSYLDYSHEKRQIS